jgi:hypothetical protein
MPVILFHNPRYSHTTVPQRTRCDMKGTAFSVTDQPSTRSGSVVLKRLLSSPFKYVHRHNFVRETYSVVLNLYFVLNVCGLSVKRREAGRARLQCDVIRMWERRLAASSGLFPVRFLSFTWLVPSHTIRAPAGPVEGLHYMIAMRRDENYSLHSGYSRAVGVRWRTAIQSFSLSFKAGYWYCVLLDYDFFLNSFINNQNYFRFYKLICCDSIYDLKRLIQW